MNPTPADAAPAAEPAHTPDGSAEQRLIEAVFGIGAIGSVSDTTRIAAVLREIVAGIDQTLYRGYADWRRQEALRRHLGLDRRRQTWHEIAADFETQTRAIQQLEAVALRLVRQEWSRRLKADPAGARSILGADSTERTKDQ